MRSCPEALDSKSNRWRFEYSEVKTFQAGLMHIGYEEDTGHVYEGEPGRPEYAVVPAPLLTQAKLFEGSEQAQELPRGLSIDALRWLFREDSFDPVTRVRRGRLYEPFPGGQPADCLTQGHPANVVRHNLQTAR